MTDASRLLRSLCRVPLEIAACLLVSAAAASSGLDPNVALRFERLSLEEGLSQTTINAIVQDRLGFVWFGTEDGLNRFDGYRFTTFKSYPDDPESLADSYIWSLATDRSGGLWVGTGRGLNRWDPRTRKFTRIQGHADGAGPGTRGVRAVLEDRDGGIWVGTDGGGVSRYDPGTGAWSALRHDPADPTSLADDRVHVLHEDRQGILWIGTYGAGLDAYDRKSGRLEHLRRDPREPDSLASDRIHSILETRAGELWVGTYDDGLTILDPRTRRTRTLRHHPAQPQSLGSGRVRAILEDGAGRIWVGTDGGLQAWDPERGCFTGSPHDPTDRRSLGDDQVTALYEDRSRVLWVGTKNAGVSKWNPETAAFGLHRRNPAAATSLSNDRIASFWYDPGADALWIGTFGGGLDRLDRKSGTYTHYADDPRNPEAGPGDNRIMSLLLDREGMLWIGTYEAGLAKLDPRTGRFLHFRHRDDDPSSISSDAVTTILEDRSGALWTGTFGGGLDSLDRKTSRFTRYQPDPKDGRSLGSDRVTCLLEDRSGVLWVGTDGGGLNRMDREKGTFDRILHDPRDPRSLSGDVVGSLFEDEAGTLWIGTQGAGLDRWARADREAGISTFRRFTERNGLPSNHVVGILPDDDGGLWLSTNRGLSRLDPTTGHFRNYDATEGLQSDEFNFGAHHRAPGGELFFGGVAGFNAFHPGRLLQNEQPPPVVVTSLTRHGAEVPLDRPLGELDEIVLDHRDGVVTLQLAALDYRDPARNRYAYRLVGQDDDWIELGSDRRITFTRLAAGSYELRVRASNNDGRWSDEATAARLRVLPPPWLTVWAFGIYAAMLSAVAVAIVRALRSRRRREKQYRVRLEREVDARTSELAERNVELRTLLRERDETARERERLQERVAQAQKLESLAVLAGGVAHDFNNLLTGIVGNVSIALSSHDERQRLARLRRVQEAADRAAELTRQMLACAGKGQLVREAVRLSQVVQEAASHVELPEAGRPVLLLDLQDDLPSFRADSTQVAQIVTNLVKNSIEATSDRVGTVRCTTLARIVDPSHPLENHLGEGLTPGAYACLEVQDDGRGMDEATRARIFDPFFTTKFTGRGLGLPAVLGIVRSLRGHVTVDSAPGRGTSIRVYFPLDRAAEEAGEAATHVVEHSVARGGKVLVVDDEEAIRELAELVLEDEGWKVVTAADGSQGISVFRRHAREIGAVLLDVTMPVMTGDQVLREIRATHPFCPVVLSSGFSEQDAAGNFLDDPYVLFLQKPYSPAALVERIRLALEIEERSKAEV